MNTTLDVTAEPVAAGRRAGGSTWPGLLLVIGAAVLGDGALLTSAYRGSSLISDDRLSYPWDGATAVTTSLVWGAAQVLLVLGLVAFARSGPIVGRAGRRGAWVAVAGASLHVVAHALSVLFHDAELSDGGAVVVLSLFGVGTVLTAVGMVVAGVDVRRSGAWPGWRGLTPLVLGGWMLVMIPLQFTAALPVAVGVYALTWMALGVAMVQAAAAPTPEGTSSD